MISCAGKSQLKSWRNGAYEGGRVNSILVVGVSKDAEIRNYFGSVFVKQFERAGIRAQAVDSIVSADKVVDKDAVKAAAQKQKLQAVLITHLESEGSKEVYQPGPTGGQDRFDYYYRWVYGTAQMSGYYKKEKYAKLVSKLYDTASEEVIWTGVSEFIDPGSAKDIISTLAPEVIKGMREDKVIQ
jgi:hypothetical protein